MSIVSAVILGILQGLTEFLPVSSSGHLAIGKHILDFESPDMLFDVMLHACCFNLFPQACISSN